MNRKIDYKINENDTGKTVEGFLKERGYTHQVLVRLKQTDHGILRNGIWAYTNERLCKDDLITVQIVENCSNRCLQKAKICYHRAMSFVHLSMHLPQLE